MKNKKQLKTVKIIVIILIIIFVIGSTTIYYFSTTMSYNQVVDYCKNHSARNATDFHPLLDEMHTKKKYLYVFSENGYKNMDQELFIFREKRFLGLDLSRYTHILDSVNSENDAVKSNSPVGSVQFYAKNDNDEVETSSTLICFGEVADADIKKCTFTVKTEFGETESSVNTYTRDQKVWVLRFYGLTSDSQTLKEIHNMKFYDNEDNLVYEMK